jgi:hypothetical protein
MAISLSNELVNKFINLYLNEVKTKLSNAKAFNFGSAYHKGLAVEEGFIKGDIPIIDRDPHATGPGTQETLGESKQVKISRLWGTKLMRVNSTVVKRYDGKQESEKIFADYIGRSFANAFLRDVYDVAIGAAVAAISNESSLVHGDGSANFDYSLLNQGLAKFGDNSMALRTLIMRGSDRHKLIEDGTSAKAVENVMGALISGGEVNGFGRDLVTIDAEGLNDGATNYVLALVANAIEVMESEERDYLLTKGGGDNIHYSMQFQGGYDIGLLGYSYKQADQNVAATRAEILTPANWEKVAENDKQTAGVLMKVLA